MNFDKVKFLAFYNNSPDAAACYDALQKALTEIGIYTDLTLVGALATVRIECGRAFRAIEENYIKPGYYFVGAQYEGRIDLGNNEIGDGAKFKGRGFIQLTGRANYTIYDQKLGIDLISHPEMALSVGASAKILAQYFKDRACNVACDAKNWGEVRRLVNGGNGTDVLAGGTTHGVLEFKNKILQYLS